MGALAAEPEGPAERTKRVVIVAGAVALSAAAVSLALLLGAWGFAYRRYSLHETRLRRLLAHQPRLEQVVEGLSDEGSPLVESPKGETELRLAASRRAGPKREEVLRKGLRWPQTRVFLAGDMVYFIYFDADGVMRDFTCLSQ